MSQADWDNIAYMYEQTDDYGITTTKTIMDPAECEDSDDGNRTCYVYVGNVDCDEWGCQGSQQFAGWANGAYDYGLRGIWADDWIYAG